MVRVDLYLMQQGRHRCVGSTELVVAPRTGEVITLPYGEFDVRRVGVMPDAMWVECEYGWDEIGECPDGFEEVG